MKKVLMVDDEQPFLTSLQEGLSDLSGEYEVMTAENGLEAVKILQDARPDVVVTDLHMPVMNGFELLAYMSREHRDIPVIVLTGFGNAKVREGVNRLGSFPFLEKPVDFPTLIDHIREASGGNSSGCVSGFSLANFLQIAEVEQKTRSLRIFSGGRTGYMFLDGGELVEARYGDLYGDKAAVKMFGWKNPRIEIMIGGRLGEKNVESSLVQLIMEADRAGEESGTESVEKGHELLSEGIRLAEGLHFMKARDKLSKYLKKNPRSLTGWLWYSRVALSKKAMETALKNANFLAPADPEVREEIRKFALSVRLIDEETIRHCPLCWTAIRKYAPQCPNCMNLLTVHRSGFKAVGIGRAEILRQARERLQRVCLEEYNAKAHYYLAIAFFNMPMWEKALHYLQETVRLDSSNEFFSKQLGVLTSFVASQTPEAELEETSPTRGVQVPETANEQQSRKSILVVEDSPTTRKVISMALANTGLEIHEARDGLEALSRLSENKPDLILLDIVLPRMDGYEILAVIKRNPEFKQIPVIMLTSKDGLINKMKGRLAGSTAYLTKPFDPRQLVSTVEKHLA